MIFSENPVPNFPDHAWRALFKDPAITGRTAGFLSLLYGLVAVVAYLFVIPDHPAR